MGGAAARSPQAARPLTLLWVQHPRGEGLPALPGDLHGVVGRRAFHDDAEQAAVIAFGLGEAREATRVESLQSPKTCPPPT